VVEKPTSRAIKDFLGEADEIIENLNLDLSGLEDGAESGESDPEILNSIFRGAHSLKGISGMFGFNDISELAHHTENLLDSLRLGKIPLNGILVETLFDVLETLAHLVQNKSGGKDCVFDLTPLLVRIDNLLSDESKEKVGLLEKLKIDPEILGILTEYEEHRLLENFKKGHTLLRVKATFELASFDQELAEVTEVLKKQGEVISTLPCPGDFSARIGFQILFGTSSTVEQIATLLERENVLVELIEEKEAKSPSQEKQAEKPPLATDAKESQEGVGISLRSISRTVRVDIDKLDSLMNVVGELVLAKGAVATICERLKVKGDSELATELQKATRNLERRLDELQKGVMEVRMVPVAQLFEKMNRIIRKVANEHGKKIALDIRGAETELDKLIVEDLSDPLMHIIRNSIDHGIEPAAERFAAGKPEKGTICLWASQKGNHVAIEVRDDGRGIDPEKVRCKAVQKGLIAEGIELSRDDILDLIFTAGFSTRDEVSDLSGRGVGMDVVKNNISALSGMIEVDSRVGEGTTITITLPITLAIIKVLVVRVSGETYAIPINSVMETLMIELSAIRTIERREVIDLRQTTLPLLRLTAVFNLAGCSGSEKRSFVVVVGMAGKKMGIVVDELLGQQDAVIKSLGSTLSFVRGIAGAADLGNQKTTLVLDVGGLMSEALRGESAFYV
jgi:two-component system, chemotaxis family, sensor kinase CheA